jgi:hypothetical protein
MSPADDTAQSSQDPAANRRLGIIVPYRHRKAHLDAFIPHMQEFFELDPTHRGISCAILVVEQADDLPFNRAALLNIGFQYLKNSIDYICFHDVDTLPIAADYRWPEQPSMLLSEGLPFEPEFIRQLFSSVVIMQKGHFEAANGFSNQYWGWGFEDVDLRERLLRCGLNPKHRAGAYRRLPHTDLGSHADGSPTSDHLKNQKLYAEQWFDKAPAGWIRKKDPPASWTSDGLSSIELDPMVVASENQRAARAPTSRFAIERISVVLQCLANGTSVAAIGET